jgi:hypothetical protein
MVPLDSSLLPVLIYSVFLRFPAEKIGHLVYNEAGFLMHMLDGEAGKKLNEER